MLGALLDGDERHEQRGGQRDAADDEWARPTFLRSSVDRQQQRQRTEAEGRRARDVEPAAAIGRHLGQHRGGQQQRRQRERHLGDEDPAPAEGLHDRTSGDDADHRRAGAHHRPPTHRLRSLVRRERAVDDRQRCGPLGRTDGRSDRPTGDERGRVRSDCREPGEDAHAAEAVEVDAALSAQIGELARRWSEHGERQQRRRDDPRKGALVRMQVSSDPRDRVGQDRDREPDREQPEQRGREDDPRVARVRFDLSVTLCLSSSGHGTTWTSPASSKVKSSFLDTISLPCGSLERDVMRPPEAPPPAAASPDSSSPLATRSGTEGIYRRSERENVRKIGWGGCLIAAAGEHRVQQDRPSEPDGRCPNCTRSLRNVHRPAQNSRFQFDEVMKPPSCRGSRRERAPGGAPPRPCRGWRRRASRGRWRHGTAS